MLLISSFIIAFVFVFIGSITDLKTREVPDWINYSFLFTGFIINLIYAVLFNNYFIVLNSIAGFIFGFLLALLLFYTGQWGGGDSKMLIAIFTLIGFNVQTFYLLIMGNLSFLNYLLNSSWFLFIVNLGIAGAIYSILFSIYLIIKHKKSFFKEFEKYLKPNHNEKMLHFVRNFALIILIIVMVSLILDFESTDIISLLILGILPLFIFYSWILSKSLETVCMHKKISAKKITIGDWVIKDVFITRKTKNLLHDSFKEYLLRSDGKITFTKYLNLITKQYLRKSNSSYAKYLIIVLNKNKFNEKFNMIRNLLSSNSKSQLLKKYKKYSLTKNDVDALLFVMNENYMFFDKSFICGFNSTGLNESQVKIFHELYLKKKLRTLFVKEGLPFVPSFLIALIVYFFLGFWWLYIPFF